LSDRRRPNRREPFDHFARESRHVLVFEPFGNRAGFLCARARELRAVQLEIAAVLALRLERSGVKDGLCLVNAMHITASVFINDDEPGLHADYKRWLEWLAPYDASPERYHHNRTGEDNGDAHHKRQVMGREIVAAITAGKLDFGPWEQIFYGEFDGRRAKRVLVKVIGE